MDGEPEKIILNNENIDNLLNMINSVDEENRVVALSCIDNLDFNNNLAYILSLKKEGKATAEQWRTHAPKTSELLKSINVDLDSIITYKGIQNVLISRNVGVEQIQFYLDRFIKEVHKDMKNQNYDLIETIEVTAKIKTSHGEQTRTIS